MSREAFEKWQQDRVPPSTFWDCWQAAQAEMQEQLNKNRYLINALESSIEQYDARVKKLEAKLTEVLIEQKPIRHTHRER